MEDCIFCKIIKKEIGAPIKFENDSVIAFVTNKPAAEVHILIVPKKHISTLLDIKDEDREILFEMKQVIQGMVENEGLKDGYKLIFNGGKYQSVMHLHWHLLGGKFESEWESKI